jgi:alkanesulfonate monooxygenase SsuD/methylene tetrahydromethanopterin reductase-like flavin-dependent oxidoreductase (luciferase family)
MQIGVQLPEVEREVSWSEVVDIARTVEDCGFDSIWVGDHLLYRDDLGSSGPWEAWTSLAALAQTTERVALGPLVAATSFHSPAMIAKMASTVDEISGGRLILGLGAGWNRVEYDAYGFPFDHRVSRFEEAFTIIRTLVREGSVDFEGSYYTMRDTELLPAARPDMPILIGSNGPRMLRIGAPHIDMWNTWHVWFGNDPQGLPPLIAELETACQEVGRDPTKVEKTAAVYVELSRGAGRRAGSEERPEAPPIKGSHEEMAKKLRGFETVGLDHVQIVLDPIDAAGVEELASIVDLL